MAREKANEVLLGAVGDKPQATAEQLKAKLDDIYSRTDLLRLDKRLELFDKATSAQLKLSKDPAIALGSVLLDLWKQYETRADEDFGKEVVETALWADARTQFLPSVEAPTQTDRFGLALGLSATIVLVSGVGLIPSFTYTSEVLAKHTGREPFDATQKVADKIKARDYREYQSSDTNEVPVAFLSDLDITGGNSGSPVLNRKGELAGVAFDGVIEAMGSDKKYLPHLSRTISVDTRYVLWVLDVVENAESLVKELSYKANIATNAEPK